MRFLNLLRQQVLRLPEALFIILTVMKTQEATLAVLGVVWVTQQQMV
jgi:hypothetical protein